MAFINIFINSRCHMSIKHNCLLLDGDNTTSYPLQDINAVMIDGYCTITAQCLSSLAQHGVAVYMCDNKHMPCVITLPYAAHYRRLHVLRNQLGMSLPTIKRLWQSIIRSKLTNSATCLELCGKNSSDVSVLVAQVTSGDKTNIEATAALRYFRLLCGADFTRNMPCMFNSCIDYTYAVVRGMIARSLAVHGLETSIGIHHCSEVNAYNLADDLIEPYRAIVDYYVYSNITEQYMTPQVRCQLVAIATVDVGIDGCIHPLSHSIEIYVQSYIRAMTGTGNLLLPQLVSCSIHAYE